MTLTDPDTGRQIRMVLGDGFDWVHLFSSDPHEGDAAPRQRSAWSR